MAAKQTLKEKVHCSGLLSHSDPRNAEVQKAFTKVDTPCQDGMFGVDGGYAIAYCRCAIAKCGTTRRTVPEPAEEDRRGT